MSRFKGDVVAHGDNIDYIMIRMALGPWPLPNWSWSGIYCYSLDEAKKKIAQLEAIIDRDVQYYTFICAINSHVVDEKAGKAALEYHKANPRREYSI